ncbi:MAG TPA: hypothetical protein VEG65_04840 [Candidatus Bathyarchaeia archaeon]|nr:hypothetical protein [Candidatus Bathyarchaeia archaeon]
MPVMPVKAEAAEAGAAAVAPTGGAAAAVAGSGQASTSTQVIKQSNTQTITTGAVTNSGTGTINIGSSGIRDTIMTDDGLLLSGQTNYASQANVPVNIHASDIQVAWDNGTATGST